MKTIHTLKRWSIVIVILVIGFQQTMAQARYKHLPRVRIEKTATYEKPVVVEKLNIPVVAENKEALEQQATPEVTEVASVTKEDVTVVSTKKTTHSKLTTIEKPAKENKQAFSESVKKKSHILEVKEVKKTAIIGYLLWFLVVLLLGIALFVLAFVFLGIIAYSLYYVFLIFGIAGLAIALLILIFGLTGILA